MTRLPPLLVAAALLVAAQPAMAAGDRPPVTPTRDVDVVYMMVQPDRPGGPRVVEQRMRWAAGSQLLRLDPPTPGMWVVVDMRAHRLSAVREADRSVLQMPADQARFSPGAPPGAVTFQRQGQAEIAGLSCTEWRTADVTGAPTLACITADGVLLRAAAAGRVVVEALRVTYAAQPESVFRIPPDYRKLTPPPGQR
ncbi:conserved exported protein of unknown function [Rhodovastum atsumiense]|uniref:DUF4412 domain-containing protein n=1 Tax=Rhodovastum atsumiense TaxID=504468 RepID=A0A5M6IVX1_9PROT|nr:hypothetical protein [Rhodovastum atsumiense]KAA5612432.1 hypothetical protein F1189_09660 [Rhodovastum atsumiense]CAH2600339.1 conserved exported protein of unknown function [Rhodovastum atsumiense]